MTIPLRLVDTQLLRAFRGSQSLGISQLIDALGVTATAIRQRLQRLLEAGLIERQKVVLGRGRPAFRYGLTVAGQRYAGADPAALAEAMWQEILELSDAESRRQILAGIAKRLGQSYAACIAADDQDAELSLAEKMRRLARALSDQQIATQSSIGEPRPGRLPMLDICSCPYPVLRDAAEDRAMCQLETEIFSEALGSPVQLSHCVLDGDARCQFVPRLTTKTAAALH